MAASKKDIEAIDRLTPLQQGMLFQTLSTPESMVYFEQLSCTLKTDLDAAAFEQAWQAAADALPILRSAFVWERQAQPVRVVFRHVNVPWQNLDWRDLDETEQDLRWTRLLNDERARGFDLNRPPLMRCVLVRLQDARYRLVWNHHHLLLDGWSIPLLMTKVFSAYEAICAGEAVNLE